MVLRCYMKDVLTRVVNACQRAARRRNVINHWWAHPTLLFNPRFLLCSLLKLLNIERRILLYEMLEGRTTLYGTFPAACFLVCFGYGFS